jgi:hypothetical protein
MSFIAGAAVILVFFFIPETNWKRSAADLGKISLCLGL